MAAHGWMWGAGEGQGPIIGGVRGFRHASLGGVTAGIAGQPLLRCAEAEGTELTRGPGASERGRAMLRWGNGADGWARPVIRLARARAEGASGLSGVGARGGPGRVAWGRPGKRTLGWATRGGAVGYTAPAGAGGVDRAVRGKRGFAGWVGVGFGLLWVWV